MGEFDRSTEHCERCILSDEVILIKIEFKKPRANALGFFVTNNLYSAGGNKFLVDSLKEM